MTTLYLIRHGTTDGNTAGIFQGRVDYPLNDMGHQQGEYLARRFESVQLDAVYTSPLIRARQTAEYLCRGSGLDPIPEPGVMEISAGRLDGRAQEENRRDFPDQMDLLLEDIAKFHPPEGESIQEVYDRVREAITRIVAENPGRTVAIVAHGMALMTYNNLMHGIPRDRLQRLMMTNMAVSTVHYHQPDQPLLQTFNDDSHIPEELRYLHGGFILTGR